MAKRISAKKAVRELSLPTKPSEPQISMRDFRWMIHGFPKVGKSSIASFFPNVVFLPTEAGTKGLSVHQIPQEGAIANWQEFAQAVQLLTEEDHPFETVVIDTIDWLYLFLLERVAEQNNVDHVSDMGYGAGWDEANKRLHRALEDLYHRMGVVLISHSRHTQVNLGRRQITKTFPDLSDSPRKLLCGWVDIVVYLAVEEEESEGEDDKREITRRHVAICRPTPYIEAGGRLEKMPEEIDMGSGPKEGFGNLKGAFEGAAKAFLESLS